MFYHFKSMFVVMLTVFALLLGAFFILRPAVPANDSNPTEDISNTNTVSNTPTGNITDTQMQSGIEYYINDFSVEITPWTPSSTGERVKVSIRNIGSNTYVWVSVYIVFVDESGNTIKTVMGGSYSQIAPDDTVSLYISAEGLENAAGYVYAIEDQRFTRDPEKGFVSL